MKLYRVILPVGDIDAAEQFYSTILGIPGQRISAGRHYFDLDGTILACYDPKADDGEIEPVWTPHPKQYLYIATDQLDHIFDIIKTQGAKHVDDEIKTMPWGERMLYVNDPWDNPICFVDSKTLFTGQKI